jgi:hypothetical protein
MRKQKQLIGSVSHATMNPDHLIPRFIDAIEYFAPRRAGKLRKELDTLTNEEDKDLFLNETLFDALNEYAPAYFYFGSHPGDGCDYGFWLSEQWDQDLIDNGGIKVNDLSELPKGFTGEFAVVNDHGNATLYYRSANWRIVEVWAVV